MRNAYIRCENLVKIYKVADLEVVALQGLDLTIAEGEMVALVGPSGSGKTTLLNLLGALDTPTAGNVWVGDQNLLELSGRAQVRYRRHQVGFVWQQTGRNLLPYLSARENVELPMALARVGRRERRERADELLAAVGLTERAHHRPDRLSGGEQQRAAVAVALANRPQLLLADEPTGELDSQASAEVFAVMRRLNQEMGVTVVVVTHDLAVSGRVDRVIGIRDGRTSTEIRRRHDEAGVVLHEEEFVLLDRTGRLQLPRPYIEALDMRDRVRVRLETDHVQVRPDSER